MIPVRRPQKAAASLAGPRSPYHLRYCVNRHRRSSEKEGIMCAQHVPVTGGCLCGAVRYESQEPPTEGYYCHCSMCRKHSGNVFGATVRMRGSALRFTKGQPKYYRSSDIARRGFCSECGSPLTFVFDTLPDTWVSIGSLDHPEDWPLTKQATWGQTTHVLADTKISWYRHRRRWPARIMYLAGRNT